MPGFSVAEKRVSVLYLVGTPIGNLEDISPRALETLRGVSLIAAEDTRTAKQLLNHFEIHTPVTSFFEHSKSEKVGHILAALDANDIAVISEAGMPGINDPGFELVSQAIARGHRVSPVPGPSAVLAALVASGISANSFYYVGFLPREPQARRKFLRELIDEPETLVMFETPHRLNAALTDMEAIFGGTREICAARELTKLFEEFQRGTISQVRAYFLENEPRGEFTLVVRGRGTRGGGGKAKQIAWDEAKVQAEFAKLARKNVPRSEAVKEIARASGWDRRRVYQLTLADDKKSRLGK